MKVRNILSCALATVMAVTGLSACAAEKTVGETFVLRNGIFNTA